MQMKKTLFLLVCLLISINFISAQNDTMYVYKGGNVIIKQAVTDIDSITFHKQKIPFTVYNYIQSLGSDYSIIRDSIIKYNYKKFDPTISTPIGSLPNGKLIYDSVFVTYNPIFDKAEINSNLKQFTMFLPSNSVINTCFQTLQSNLTQMGKVIAKSDSITAFKWIKEAMFYNGVITDFTPIDINSVYGRVWRTTVQQLDLANYEEVSNGRVYKMSKVKIPNNVIISRIKSLVEYWEYQDNLYPNATDLYTFKGLTVNPAIYVTDATPKPTILPNYLVLQVSGDANSTDEFSVEFPPLEKYSVDGTTKVRVMQVPTGEYNLYMGFRTSAHPYVYVYFNGVQIGTEIQANLAVPWNYDRVTETDKDLNPTNGVAKWDGLGGLVGVVNVTREDGLSGLASFKIKVKWSKNDPAGTKTMRIYHWALKPTANNY